MHNSFAVTLAPVSLASPMPADRLLPLDPADLAFRDKPSFAMDGAQHPTFGNFLAKAPQ